MVLDYSRRPPGRGLPFPPPSPFPTPRSLKIRAVRRSPSLPLLEAKAQNLLELPSQRSSQGTNLPPKHITPPLRTSSVGNSVRANTGVGRGESEKQVTVPKSKAGELGRLQWSSPKPRDENGEREPLGTGRRPLSARERAVTEPVIRTAERAEAPGVSSRKRHPSSSHSGLIRRIESLKIGGSSIRFGDEEKAWNKGWKKRVFSRDKLGGNLKVVNPHTRTDPEGRKSPGEHARSSLRTSSTQGTGGTDVPRLKNGGTIALGGSSTEAPTESSGNPISVGDNVGVSRRKLGTRAGKGRYARSWKPPISQLLLCVEAEVDLVPIAVKGGKDVWVAVRLQSALRGETVPQYTPRVGLDVGVLLDVSLHTSPTSFGEMKELGRRIVAGMDTSTDRVVVMAFPTSRQEGSLAGKTSLKVLNPSASVAKKQLIADITELEPGAASDPSDRNVSAAVAAAIDTVRQMPWDSTRHGLKRSGHLFLISSKLDPGEIEADFCGVKVHVLGVGPVFVPNATLGGDGWCAGTALPPEIPGVAAPNEDVPGFTNAGLNIDLILNHLRTGVDSGTIENARLNLIAGDGCTIQGVLGDTSFGRMLPGDHRNLLVRVNIGDMPTRRRLSYSTNEKLGDLDFDDVNKELEATLGELKTNILTVEALFEHSLFPGTLSRVTGQACVSRYVKDSVWGTPGPNLEMPFTAHGNGWCRKSLITALFVQAIAARPVALAAELATSAARLDATSEPLLRELEYRKWIEERYGLSPSIPSSGLRASDGACRHLENLWPREATPKLPPTPSALLEALDIPERQSTVRRRAPDEAKKLWMQLGGCDDDDDEDEQGMDGMRGGRGNGGQEIMAAMRNVRETDFSPWVV